MLFSRSAPVHGLLLAFGDLLFATIDLRRGPEAVGHAEQAGIAAFDRLTGEELWRRLALPPLVARDDSRLYAYGRAGVVVALGVDGEEQWRIRVPDDRSELSRRRSDRDGPLPADVVTMGDSVAAAAGPELFLLGRVDGAVSARGVVCSGAGATIARVAQVGDNLICTCTARSTADDGPAMTARLLWNAPRTLEDARVAPGDLVALSFALEERWRRPPLTPDLVWGERRPVGGSPARIFAAAATATGSALSVFGDVFVGVDASGGSTILAREMPGGRGRFDPVATDDGVVAGYQPVLYAPDGEPRWQLRRPPIHQTIAPVPTTEGLLFAAEGHLMTVDAEDGSVEGQAALGPSPLVASPTTQLCVVEDVVYLGVEEPAGVELRAIRVTT